MYFTPCLLHRTVSWLFSTFKTKCYCCSAHFDHCRNCRILIPKCSSNCSLGLQFPWTKQLFLFHTVIKVTRRAENGEPNKP